MIKKIEIPEGDGNNFSQSQSSQPCSIKKREPPEGDGNTYLAFIVNRLIIKKIEPPEGDGNDFYICSNDVA